MASLIRVTYITELQNYTDYSTFSQPELNFFILSFSLATFSLTCFFVALAAFRNPQVALAYKMEKLLFPGISRASSHVPQFPQAPIAHLSIFPRSAHMKDFACTVLVLVPNRIIDCIDSLS